MIEAKKKIKAYLSRSVRDGELKDDDDIFDLGLVHSLFAMQLILFIEKEFGIELDDGEIDFDNIRTLNEMVSLVEHRKNVSVK